MLVQKYGGSSVGSPKKIKRVAARIADVRAKGEAIAVVVSAMGDTTDDLVALARAVSPKPPEREMDMLLTAGERISMALLSMALRDLGQDAISFTGSQAGIITDESHTRARILDIRPARVQEELAKGKVVIIAGFQGVSRSKEITTLGRGGSDTTAVALAAALRAKRCEILTDVSGIYSADPRLVPEAIRYEKLLLDTVFEMAVHGAQVMHPRAMEIAREKNFSLYVGHSQKPEGTILVPNDMSSINETPKVQAITSREGFCELHFKAAEASQILQELTDAMVVVHQLELDAKDGLRIILHPDESAAFVDRYSSVRTAFDLQSVSVIGHQLQQNASIPARILEVLGQLSISPKSLTTYSQSITVWFSGQNTTKAVQGLHAALIRS